MPEFTVDFSAAEDYTPVPVGNYEVEIVEAKVGTSQAGNAKLSLQVEIKGGEYDGRKLFDDLVLEGNPLALGRTKKTFDVFFGATNESFAGNTDNFIGIRAVVRVYHDTWTVEDGGDGETRARIRRYNPSQASDDFADALGEAMGASPAPAEVVAQDNLFE